MSISASEQVTDSGKGSTRADIDVRFTSSSMSAFEADMALACLLSALLTYRRADEASGHRFTGPEGQFVPSLPLTGREVAHAA
ncbi:MAG: hypothetical protein V4671_08670 [Armatimonadota bacterium]